VEIGHLGSMRNLMQGGIITEFTDVVCCAECAEVSMFKDDFVYCRKVESKEALNPRALSAKLVQEVILSMQDD